MLNKVFLQGRLTADPELHHTANGVAMASFRLAVDRDFKDKESGQRKADFISVTAWRQTAEFASRFLSKGRMAIVEGKLQVREFNDKDGNRRSATEVVADNIYFGDSKKDDRPKAEPEFVPPTFVDLPPDGPLPFDEAPPFDFDQLPM